ncbi:MAG: CDP-alcohol phosphatidyltransferase family protein [Firmicutes bacterium]|nr:CDP-alcohol phosphatidyltransferase family protein [Bacillota bacterium]
MIGPSVWRRLTGASLVTSIGSVAAMAAVLLTVRDDLSWALTGLAVALATDRADGWVARRWHQESAIGAQLDSLNDALAFGVLPGVIAFRLSHDMAVVGVSAIWYALMAMWRLADFNERGLEWREGQAYFRGMPTTDVAAWFLVLATAFQVLTDRVSGPGLAGFLLVGGWAMTSSFFYPKNGWGTRMLLGLVPLAVIALWMH